MKLNTDCIRDILITIESMEYNSVYTIPKLCNSLPKYSEEELNYHCIQLTDAGFLNVIIDDDRGFFFPQIVEIYDLTYSGHQFLADIRSDTIWNQTKEIASSIGSESLHALKDIAIAIVTSALQHRLGL